MRLSEQCITCKHYRLIGDCDAYPEGIPDVILRGEHDHHDAYPGDQGIRYEAMPPQKSKAIPVLREGVV